MICALFLIAPLVLVVALDAKRRGAAPAIPAALAGGAMFFQTLATAGSVEVRWDIMSGDVSASWVAVGLGLVLPLVEVVFVLWLARAWTGARRSETATPAAVPEPLARLDALERWVEGWMDRHASTALARAAIVALPMALVGALVARLVPEWLPVHGLATTVLPVGLALLLCDPPLRPGRGIGVVGIAGAATVVLEAAGYGIEQVRIVDVPAEIAAATGGWKPSLLLTLLVAGAAWRSPRALMLVVPWILVVLASMALSFVETREPPPLQLVACYAPRVALAIGLALAYALAPRARGWLLPAWVALSGLGALARLVDVLDRLEIGTALYGAALTTGAAVAAAAILRGSSAEQAPPARRGVVIALAAGAAFLALHAVRLGVALLSSSPWPSASFELAEPPSGSTFRLRATCDEEPEILERAILLPSREDDQGARCDCYAQPSHTPPGTSEVRVECFRCTRGDLTIELEVYSDHGIVRREVARFDVEED